MPGTATPTDRTRSERAVKQLGDILLEDGLVTEAQLVAALRRARAGGRPLGRVLVEPGCSPRRQLVAALAQQVGLGFVDLDDYPVDAHGGRPGARRACAGATPCCRSASRTAARGRDGRPGQRLRPRRRPLDDPAWTPRPVVATRDDLLRAIDRFCRADGELDDLTAAMSDDERDDEDDLAS